MKIAFHSNQLGLRGTEVAMYDYAKYNEELLGNNSIILYRNPEIWDYSHPLAIQKFNERFNVFSYKNIAEIEKILDEENVDIFYVQKAGFKDGVVSNKIKTVIHSVFKNNQPHGDVYAYISKWLGDMYNSPYVPYMVDLPTNNENLRKDLKIPNNAIVFGRHGGFETFDIDFVKKVVIEIAKKRKDIYFLFLFTEKFSDPNLENIIYLDGNHDLNYKVKFINTCDAMLHARKVGETFGLAIAEFSIKNKPVITYNGSMRESAHIEMLGNKGIFYKSDKELNEIIREFKPEAEKDWNAYKDYNPKSIMNKFKEVFID